MAAVVDYFVDILLFQKSVGTILLPLADGWWVFHDHHSFVEDLPDEDRLFQLRRKPSKRNFVRVMEALFVLVLVLQKSGDRNVDH